MKPVAYINQDLDRECVFIEVFKENDKSTPLYAIPKGYKLVPIEPTQEMGKAFSMNFLIQEYAKSFQQKTLSHAYKAMIDVAPNIEEIKP